MTKTLKRVIALLSVSMFMALFSLSCFAQENSSAKKIYTEDLGDCFSQPFSFACKNSCAVKPRSSSALRHRYSFCVLPCHFPWTSNGRIVSIMCAWGLCPSGSWMAKSAHIPLSTHSVWMKPRRSSSQSSRPSSTGRATINWRARRLSLVFSADSTAAHRVCRSFHAAGAWGGSKISV